MKTSDLHRHPFDPPSAASTRSPGLYEAFYSPPFIPPFQSHSPSPRFLPTSPSPDLEAILQQTSSDGLGLRRSSDDRDAFMVDSDLDHATGMLTSAEEASLPPDDTQASYGAFLPGLYDVAGEPLRKDLASSIRATSLVERSEFSWPPHIYENNSASSTDTSSNDNLHTHTLNSREEPSLGTGGKGLDEGVRSASFEAKGRPEGSDVADSIDTSFDELKIEEDYANLYIGSIGFSDTTHAGKANSRNGVKKNSSRAARRGGQGVQKAHVSAAAECVCVRDLLVRCAQAIGIGHMKSANDILLELYSVHGVSPQGNSVQRLASYFCDALVTRIAGIGSQEHGKPLEIVPPVASLAKSLRLYYHSLPILKVQHYCSNQKILEVAERCARLHILDFCGLNEMKWPCLIKALADRDGGPPLLVITAIGKPWQGMAFLEEIGKRLAAYASKWNVPFQYNALVSDKWEIINPDSLQLHMGEILVINSTNRINRVPDDCADPSSSAIPPRQRLLVNMRSLNPHLLLLSDLDIAGDLPFFASRFREVVHYLHNHADMLEHVCSDESDRFVLQEILYRGFIHNTLALEGGERVNRPELSKQWAFRLKRAGFELVRFPSAAISRAALYLKQHYHRDFMAFESAYGSFILGWKGRTIKALSAWKPRQTGDRLGGALEE